MNKILKHSIALSLAMPLASSVALAVDLIEPITGTCTFDGNNETYNVADAEMTALEIVDCEVVSVKNATFIGPAYVNPQQGTFENPIMIGGHAISIKKPLYSTYDMKVEIENVRVNGFGNHGIYIFDTEDPRCGSGSGGSCAGAEGSIQVNMSFVDIVNSGFGGQDADGLRVDERGSGDIILNAKSISLQYVGADGIELDEGDAGDVIVNMSDAFFNNNGSYCLQDGADGSDYFPVKYDYEEDQSDDYYANLPICNDEGDADVDDAFDIDEAGPGNVDVKITDSWLQDNWDEGLDFDEAGPGNVKLNLKNVTALDNVGDAVKADEEDNGNIRATLKNMTITGSKDGEGVQFTELANGNVMTTIADSTITGNFKDGVKVENFADSDEDVDGRNKGKLVIKNSEISDNDLEKEGKDQVKVTGTKLIGF